MDPCMGALPDTPASASPHTVAQTAKNRKGCKNRKNAKAEAKIVIGTIILFKKKKNPYTR